MRSTKFMLMIVIFLIACECAGQNIDQIHAQMAEIEQDTSETTTTTEEVKQSEDAAQPTITQAADTSAEINQETTSTSVFTDSKTTEEDQDVTINQATQQSPQTKITTNNAARYSSGNNSTELKSKQASSPANSPNAKPPLNGATNPTSTDETPKKNTSVPDSLSSKLPKGLQHVDKKDNSMGSSLLFAFAALSTLVVMDVGPAF